MSELPALPVWLKYGVVIGPGPNDRGYGEPDILAVGIFNDTQIDPECAEKLLYAERIGVPWVVKSVGGTKPWQSWRVAWQPELEKYDVLFLKSQGIPDGDHNFPPYPDGTLPPLPVWLCDGFVVETHRNATDQTVATALGVNTNNDELWVVETIGGYPWHSSRIANKADQEVYDAKFLASVEQALGLSVTHVNG